MEAVIGSWQGEPAAALSVWVMQEQEDAHEWPCISPPIGSELLRCVSRDTSGRNSSATPPHY